MSTIEKPRTVEGNGVAVVSSTPAVDVYNEPQGLGWVLFSAIMLAFVGVWGIIEGILAISSSKVFTANATFVFSSLNTWGWIVTGLGVLCLLAAFSLMTRERACPLVRDRRRRRERSRAAVLPGCLPVVVDGDLRDRHPDHLRPRRLRRRTTPAAVATGNRCRLGARAEPAPSERRRPQPTRSRRRRSQTAAPPPTTTRPRMAISGFGILFGGGW